MYQLQNFNARDFLARYWQRKPLLVRGALPAFENPLPANELAGLALEEEVESRLVKSSAGKWRLQHGPFRESAFSDDGVWTLLVQAVDHRVAAVAELWQLVDFLPNWRRDDIMVSFATPGGGVGPHYDNYDVFLLQGTGSRRWRLGQWCESQAPLLSHESLRILAEFEQTAEYVLEPGDLLYVPPRLAHWGEAVDECVTYSLGFRAPRLNDLLSRWLDQQLESMEADLLYTDPPMRDPANPGEISSAACRQALELVQAQLAQASQSMRWLGELVTEPARTVDPTATLQTAASLRRFRLDPGARLAWSRDGNQLTVFANGTSLDSSVDCLPLLQDLIRGKIVDREASAAAGAGYELLAQLLKLGCIYGE